MMVFILIKLQQEHGQEDVYKRQLEKNPVNKDKLRKLVEKAEKYEKRIDQYTAQTAQVFTTVLADARNVLADTNAGQELSLIHI